jgi:hypothetical protein
MFRRLKQILVETFVGTIALGWLFAQAVMHTAYAIVAPLVNWLLRDEYRGLTARAFGPAGLSVKDAAPELLRALSLLLAGYLLLRWLYCTPITKTTAEPELNPETTD